MTTAEFLSHLRRLDVKVWVENDNLVCNGPEAVLTRSLEAELRDRKREILDFLERAERDAVFPIQPIVSSSEQRHLPFPLTDIQQAYWIGRTGAFEIGNVATHAYLELQGVRLHLDRLHLSWRRLIERHDVLRAVVLPDGQQQILEDVPPYQIEVLDLSGQEPQMVESRLGAIREHMSHQVLPSDEWPLFEIRVSLLDGQRVRVHMSFDGLILDGWSMVILLKEWSQLYRALETPLVPLELSFRDYVLTDIALQNSEAYWRSRDYWQRRLPSLPPAPQLSLAKNPSSVKNPRSVRRSAALEPETWQRLKRRAAQAGVTPNGVLLTAYADVLSVWSKSCRFTINVPRFNRLAFHPQINDIVGQFASLTLLEVDHSATEGFEDRARRLQKRLWEDLDHSQFSGVRVMRELAQVQEKGSGALMPVVFTSAPKDSHGSDMSVMTLPELFGDVIYTATQSSQVWLDNHVAERGGALLCNWDSVDELFPEGLSQEMFDCYFYLLRSLANEEECWQEAWSKLAQKLVPTAQLDQRAAVNATEAPVPDGLLQSLFVKQVPQRREQAAVVAPTRSLTYQELYRLSNQWGGRLRQLGARPNRLVAVSMEKGWEQIVAALGILQSGAAYLPIDPGLPKDRLWHLLEQGQVKLVLTQSWLDQNLEWPIGVQRLSVDKEDLTGANDQALEPVQKAEDLAYVIFTSGSTGLPKGVMIGHRGLVNAVVHTNQCFHVGAEDRLLALTALHHDMSVYDIFGILAAGGTIIVPPACGSRDPAIWSELMLREQVTVWNSVPAMMEMLLEYAAGRPRALPHSLRAVFLGGDWIPVSIPARLKTLVPGAQVVSVGGPTETTLWNIWHPVEAVDPAWKSIPYGRPIANTRYYVLNGVLGDCPVWVPGELYCAGVGLAQGYWRDEEQTRSKFFHHPRTGERIYRTGDFGRYLPDGNIEFLGREDFQVKIQGQRIELGEIEATLQKHRAVNSAVVIAIGEMREKKLLVAYFVPVSGSAPTSSELRSFLQGSLPEHMIPSAFMMLDALPLTANGKVDRRSLIDRAQSSSNNFQEPNIQTVPRVTEIARIVASVLQIDRVDPDANLTTLGANSIDMIRIGNHIDRKWGVRPSMAQLFRLQTIRALAGYCDQHLLQSQTSTGAEGRDLKPGIESLLASYRVLVDPKEREAFKREQPGLRRGDNKKPYIQLTRPEQNETFRNKYVNRRSYREFSIEPIPFQQFSRFLSCVHQIILDGNPKYLYASPGGLYPTQTYLHFKPGRVEGVSCGTYYYHPVDHRLVLLSAGVEIDQSIHIPFINTPIFDKAAFSIFLIAQLAAIAPAYGERSIHYVTLEAGAMAYLFETSATVCGIGLCQIGNLDFKQIQHLFALDESHVLVHSLLGGRIDNNRWERWLPFQEATACTGVTMHDREEGKL